MVTLRRGMPFGELQGVLKQLGFHQVNRSDRFLCFEEQNSGALFLLPDYADDEEVRGLHLNALRKLLEEKGLVESVVALGLDR